MTQEHSQAIVICITIQIMSASYAVEAPHEEQLTIELLRRIAEVPGDMKFVTVHRDGKLLLVEAFPSNDSVQAVFEAISTNSGFDSFQFERVDIHPVAARQALSAQHRDAPTYRDPSPWWRTLYSWRNRHYRVNGV